MKEDTDMNNSTNVDIIGGRNAQTRKKERELLRSSTTYLARLIELRESFRGFRRKNLVSTISFLSILFLSSISFKTILPLCLLSLSLFLVLVSNVSKNKL